MALKVKALGPKLQMSKTSDTELHCFCCCPSSLALLLVLDLLRTLLDDPALTAPPFAVVNIEYNNYTYNDNRSRMWVTFYWHSAYIQITFII